MALQPKWNATHEDLLSYLRRQRRLLSPKEVAVILGKHRETIYRMVHERELPVILDGARWKIDPARLADWLEERVIYCIPPKAASKAGG